jgi:hypothetical protein
MRARAADGFRRLLIHGGSHEFSSRPAVACITTRFNASLDHATRGAIQFTELAIHICARQDMIT